MKRLHYWLRAEIEGVKSRSEIQSMFDAAGVKATVCKDLDRYDYEDGCETSFDLRVELDASVCESPYPSQAFLELGMSEDRICEMFRVEGIVGPRVPDSPTVRWAK